MWSELEEEYKRQIEHYKAEEKRAKDALRQCEKTFLQERQELESRLEKEQSVVWEGVTCDA